ncbi:unnamed protein product [Parnassius apollo]|uniref:(apollo) hypothetical protein n=1 Tax=Parnassius apollo TaxID=110799 RepID=A0A8S3XKG4_PARAO|nr:unnamed protein product [Parnassius apollo]
MSFPPRPPMVPYGIAPGVVTMPMATHVMVGAYGGSTISTGAGRGALLPAPLPAKQPPPPRPVLRQTNGKEPEGPAVTVFIGNISSRVPDTMIRALLSACGPVLSWKRVSTFGFCEFAGPEAALRCVRLLHEFALADKKLLARTDGKMQALVDTYKTEQRSRLTGEEAPGGGRGWWGRDWWWGGRRGGGGLPGRGAARAGRGGAAPAGRDHARPPGRDQQLRAHAERGSNIEDGSRVRGGRYI